MGCPNGALWTITVFVQFYIVVFVLHHVLHNKGKFKWGGVLLTSVLLNIVPEMIKSLIPETIYKLYQQTVFPYLIIFMFAAFFAEYENRFRKMLNSRGLCIALYVILLVGLPFDIDGAGYSLFKSALITIFAIVFGNTVNCPYIKKDISYEVYLVHMPIANIFVELLEKQNWKIFTLTTILVYLAAYLLYQVNNKVVRNLEQ